MANDRQTVIVTGAAGGIGRAACERLLASGWNVLAVDSNAEKLGWVEDGPHIARHEADVTSEQANLEMVARAERLFGGVNALLLNAGVSMHGSVEDMPFETFRRVVEVNLYGPLLGVRAALPALRRQGGGAIVVTSSTMGVGGDSESAAYASSKHGVIGLVRSLSRELGWENIRINALCPGLTRGTGMTGHIEAGAPEYFEQLTKTVPLQRWAEPDEQAAVMEFLISPAASFVSGHAMVADAGSIVGTGLMPAKSGANVIPGGAHQ